MDREVALGVRNECGQRDEEKHHETSGNDTAHDFFPFHESCLDDWRVNGETGNETYSIGGDEPWQTVDAFYGLWVYPAHEMVKSKNKSNQ